MGFGPYYFVKGLPLYELITHEFINTFVKKGKKNHAVSVNMLGCGRQGGHIAIPGLLPCSNQTDGAHLRGQACAARPPPLSSSACSVHPQVWFLVPQVHTRPVGVLSHKARGEEELSGLVLRCAAVGRGCKDRCALCSARNSRLSMLVSWCSHTAVYTARCWQGPSLFRLDPAALSPICVCWVDWLVPVTSREPLQRL